MVLPAEIARYIVKAFKEHDKKNYTEAAKYFAKVYAPLFPSLSPYRIETAAAAYTAALKAHDVIDESGLPAEKRLMHANWADVEAALLEHAHALGIAERYAAETKEFWRWHSIGDNRYIKHCLAANEAFVEAVTGSTKLSVITGGLYLACVGCHDRHDALGFQFGEKIMTKYFALLLEHRK